MPPLDPGDPNDELKAMVSVAGATAALHQANGSSTSFNRSIDPVNGDTILYVSGSIGEYGTAGRRNIEIRLINIHSPGTYDLKNETSSRQQVFCMYTIGGIFFSPVFEMYSSDQGTPPGSVTIEALSATAIKGSFTANCSNNEKGINYVQITNGSFKGTFTK